MFLFVFYGGDRVEEATEAISGSHFCIKKKKKKKCIRGI